MQSLSRINHKASGQHTFCFLCDKHLCNDVLSLFVLSPLSCASFLMLSSSNALVETFYHCCHPSALLHLYIPTSISDSSQAWLAAANRRTQTLRFRTAAENKTLQLKNHQGHIDIDFSGRTHLSIYLAPLGLTDGLGCQSTQEHIILMVHMKLDPESH